MRIEDIEATSIWTLYEKGRNYHRLIGIYRDTDRNYRFYNGNQWEGVKLGDVEPVQKNFIKPIVKYKNAVIHDNLYAIHFSSQNFENREFALEAEGVCEMLNRYAANVWEKDEMDYKVRKITKDASINDEGIMYVYWDDELKMPVNEVVKKNDVYYGNENDEDIESQPYILIRKRMPVSNAVEYALAMGVSKEDAFFIIGDNDTFEESGDAAKEELDNMVTIVYKFYKKDGTVHFATATRWLDIVKEQDTGLKKYPVAHFNWEEKEGSARGEGEVRWLIPNQIEVNKTEVRRVLTVKHQAYPHKVVDTEKVANPNALNRVGGVIKTKGNTVDDVRKVVGTIAPAQMSPDVKELQQDLIDVTRELAGAGEIATGQVDPANASGRAILAVQQASKSPMTEQTAGFKRFLECVARIWLEYMITYSPDGIALQQETTDPMSGETMVQMVTVQQVTLRQLQAVVKVDVTPKSPYDSFAQEQTLENFFLQGLLTPDRVNELEIYATLLDDDSVAPKVKILEAVETIREEQRRISEINMQAQLMKQSAGQFLMGDVGMQAGQIADVQTLPETGGTEVNEENPDDN